MTAWLERVSRECLAPLSLDGYIAVLISTAHFLLIHGLLNKIPLISSHFSNLLFCFVFWSSFVSS